MQRTKIKIVTGVPLNVTLESEPRQSTSPITGLEYLYNVQHQGVSSLLYLHPAGQEALLRAGARVGDDVQIIRSKGGDDPIYTAKVFSDATLALDKPDRFDEHMHVNGGNGYHNTAPESPRAPIRMLAPRQQQQQARPQEQRLAPANSAVYGVGIAQILMSVVDAFVGCEQFALKKGKTLNFAEEDIVKFAITVYIGKEKEVDALCERLNGGTK